MNTLIKTTIGVIVLAVGSTSFALAEKHDGHRGGDGSRKEHSSHDYKVRGERKHFRTHKREMRHSYLRGYRDRHNKNHYRKHSYHGSHHAKRHYRHGGHRKVVKHVVRHNDYGYRRHHGHGLSTLMGGLIGSAIGHDLGRGDPVATATGAIFGSVMGRALSH